MKEDFQTIKEQLPGILKIASDFYGQPKKRGSHYFIKSPKTSDRTWSLCLYPSSNTYCDFAGGNHSGDSISLISYLMGTDNWTALQTLKDFYGLSDAKEQDKQELRRKIQRQQEQERKKRQQEQERKKRQRQQAFETALFSCTDDLQRWANIYRLALKNRLYEPLSDMWCYTMDELQRTEYKLDILCGSDQSEYRFMKASSDCIPSDYPQWLLDALSILAECGAFQPTREEIKKITAQRDFELTRKPGGERRCKVEW